MENDIKEACLVGNGQRDMGGRVLVLVGSVGLKRAEHTV